MPNLYHIFIYHIIQPFSKLRFHIVDIRTVQTDRQKARHAITLQTNNLTDV